MATTLQISQTLQKELNKKKIFDRETYEEVIWDLIEDAMELNEETKRELTEAREEIKKGKFHTLEKIKKEFRL